jgi:hypothetical protein
MAALLPVRLVAGGVPLKKPVSFRPTAAGIRIGILQLDKDQAESAKAWESLPPLAGADKLGEPKSTAEVLATAAGGEPLLVTGQYQSGRVAALAVSTTRQWQMEGQDEPPGKYFRRFWRQLLLFLSGQEERRGNVWVTTDEQRYSLAELQNKYQAIMATAGVADGQGNPVTDATCTLSLTVPSGDKRPVVLSHRGDIYEAALEATQIGDYQLELTAFRAGKQVGSARTRFVVYLPDVELEAPEANPKAQEELSRISGGRFVAAAQLGDLLETLLSRSVPSQVRFERRSRLWDNFYVLALFVGLLTAEWAIRRRLGLV